MASDFKAQLETFNRFIGEHLLTRDIVTTAYFEGEQSISEIMAFGKDVEDTVKYNSVAIGYNRVTSEIKFDSDDSGFLTDTSLGLSELIDYRLTFYHDAIRALYLLYSDTTAVTLKFEVVKGIASTAIKNMLSYELRSKTVSIVKDGEDLFATLANGWKIKASYSGQCSGELSEFNITERTVTITCNKDMDVARRETALKAALLRKIIPLTDKELIENGCLNRYFTALK